MSALQICDYCACWAYWRGVHQHGGTVGSCTYNNRAYPFLGRSATLTLSTSIFALWAGIYCNRVYLESCVRWMAVAASIFLSFGGKRHCWTLCRHRHYRRASDPIERRNGFTHEVLLRHVRRGNSGEELRLGQICVCPMLRVQKGVRFCFQSLCNPFLTGEKGHEDATCAIPRRYRYS